MLTNAGSSSCSPPKLERSSGVWEGTELIATAQGANVAERALAGSSGKALSLRAGMLGDVL